MSDLLGEALAWYDKHTPNGAISQMDTILVAARNWHTLTRHTEPAYEAVGRWYLRHYGIDFPASDAHAMLDAAVDALTDTAEPDDNLPDVKSRWYANTTEPE